MKQVKPIKITYTVEVTVECNEPESFKNNGEFEKEDGAAMVPYLRGKITEGLAGSYSNAAYVSAVSVSLVKVVLNQPRYRPYPLRNTKAKRTVGRIK